MPAHEASDPRCPREIVIAARPCLRSVLQFGGPLMAARAHIAAIEDDRRFR
jgi:hypothetical protein